jgi:hypothetical protein
VQGALDAAQTAQNSVKELFVEPHDAVPNLPRFVTNIGHVHANTNSAREYLIAAFVMLQKRDLEPLTRAQFLKYQTTATAVLTSLRHCQEVSHETRLVAQQHHQRTDDAFRCYKDLAGAAQHTDWRFGKVATRANLKAAPTHVERFSPAATQAASAEQPL